MSLERVLKVLMSLGFTRTNAEVYVYLVKTGPQKGMDMTVGLNMTKQQLYPILRSLQKKGVVSSSSEQPALFSALTLEELLNHFVKMNIDQAQNIKETKEDLLLSWRSMIKRTDI
jgi:sugar-specific transcriptional regulator TrmB